jgi:dethiobiotin synthetase
VTHAPDRPPYLAAPACPSGILVVSGTGTGVGKTVVTAAIAAVAARAGQRVAVVKAAQTGIEPGDESDLEVITRLSGVTDVHELARYPAPLAPASSARLAGVDTLPVSEMATMIRDLRDRDLVLVEGAGGLLVRLDLDGGTLADLARELRAPVIVVTTAGLGSLNATALTCEALRMRTIECHGIVIGSWPDQPDLAATTNVDDFPTYGRTLLLGALPDGMGDLDPDCFAELAQRALSHRLWSSLLQVPLSLVSLDPIASGRL